jgi:hypothetical protein
MQRSLILTLSLALVLVVGACSNDETADADPVLTQEQREWCGYTGSPDTAAQRFDQIFEIGLGLGLGMDALNAQASARRTEFSEQGMSDEEAIASVFDELLESPDYIAACQEAHAFYNS